MAHCHCHLACSFYRFLFLKQLLVHFCNSYFCSEVYFLALSFFYLFQFRKTLKQSFSGQFSQNFGLLSWCHCYVTSPSSFLFLRTDLDSWTAPSVEWLTKGRRLALNWSLVLSENCFRTVPNWHLVSCKFLCKLH